MRKRLDALGSIPGRKNGETRQDTTTAATAIHSIPDDLVSTTAADVCTLPGWPMSPPSRDRVVCSCTRIYLFIYFYLFLSSGGLVKIKLKLIIRVHLVNSRKNEKMKAWSCLCAWYPVKNTLALHLLLSMNSRFFSSRFSSVSVCNHKIRRTISLEDKKSGWKPGALMKLGTTNDKTDS